MKQIETGSTRTAPERGEACVVCGLEGPVAPCDELGYRITRQAERWASEGQFEAQLLCSGCRRGG